MIRAVEKHEVGQGAKNGWMVTIGVHRRIT